MRFFLLLIPIIISACDTTIDIRSTPPGAEVTEAAKGYLGKTPMEVSFNEDDCPDKQYVDETPCLASFSFSKPGYKLERVDRVVEGGSMLVHAFLHPVETNLQVSVFPGFATIEAQYQKVDGDWSKLSLSGTVENTLSLNDEAIWNGREYLFVKLTIESSGYIPETKKITVRKGEQKQYEYALKEYAIKGNIDSSPPGADVYEKSLGYLGRTPFSIRIPYDQLVRISPQRRLKLDDPVYLFLQFKKTGYQSVSQVTQVAEINESEKPEPFNILIRLSPIQEEH